MDLISVIYRSFVAYLHRKRRFYVIKILLGKHTFVLLKSDGINVGLQN